MSKPKNKYLELMKNGSIKEQIAENRTVNQLHSAFLSLKGYRKIKDHIVELEINGVISTIAIFRVVPEGTEKVKTRKRVQIRVNNLDRVPDYIVAAYLNDGEIYYIRSTEIKSVTDLPPNNVTTLFRVDIRELKKSILKKAIIISGVHSRGKKTNLIISRSFDKLFKENDLIEEKESTLDFISKEDFEPIIIEDEKNNNYIDETKRKIIGDVAEYIVNKELQNNVSEIYKNIQKLFQCRIKNFEWMNKDGESHLPYDFIINNYYFLEVKGSEKKFSFFYSNNEKKHGYMNRKKYGLIKLNFVEIINKKYKNLNSYTYDDLMSLDMEPISYLVKEKDDE